MTTSRVRTGAAAPPRAFRRPRRRVLPGLLIAFSLGGMMGAAEGQATPPAAARQPQTPAQKQEKSLAKLAEPWPDAATLEKRRLEAEERSLFQSKDPLAITIRADFKTVNRDRNPDSTKRFPATLILAGAKGEDVSVPIQIGTRGNLRLRADVCAFAPLKIELPKSGLQGTALAGQDRLKLATHCQNSAAYDQYVLREYLVYQLFNVLTPWSFRARLVKATYLDAATGAPLTTRFGFFIEDDEDVARRMKGRVAQVTGQRFPGLDNDLLLLMSMFHWMIGNTDFSIVSRHNVVLVQVQTGIRYPVTYDFDSAGLVDTPYAAPDKRLEITSIRQRLFRGPCRTMEQYEPILGRIREKKASLLAVYDSAADLTDRSRRDSKAYLEEFFGLISNADRVKRVLLSECLKGAGM